MILKFSSSLYSKAAIDFATKQYREYANIKITKTKKSFDVTLTGIDSDFKDALPGEFSNSALLAMREGT